MLLDAGHILHGKPSNRMKTCGFTIHERVHKALRIVAARTGLDAAYIARGWIQSFLKNQKAMDKARLLRAAEDLPGGCASHLSMHLSHTSIRQLNKLKDQWRCKLSGIVNVAIVIGLREYAHHYAEPSLCSEIEAALFGELDAADGEHKEGDVAAA